MIIVYTLLAVLFAAISFRIVAFILKQATSLSLPPGPRRWPLIGSLTGLPPKGCKEWEHWAKYRDVYGPISSVTVMRQTIIVVNDAEVAQELLEKHSNTTSSRPSSVVIRELTGWNRMVSVQGNIDIVRTHRKYITRCIGSTKAFAGFNSQLDREACHLLLRTMKQPDQIADHIRRQTGSIILNIVYGYSIEPFGQDPLVDLADLSTTQFSMAAQPGAWLIDIFPILKYLPTWFPGASIQQKAREWKRVLEILAEKPYAFVLDCRKQNTHKASYVSDHLDQLDCDPTTEEEFTIKWTAATMYGAGADTTVSALRTFYLAMALYPDVQRKAWEEIQRVIGTDRLPTLDDKEALPYINALILEVLRWHPVAPLGIPHMATEETECRGYRIPREATIICNIWSLTHDPKTYCEPMSFNPDRFLPHNGPPDYDPRNFVFGFGRRVCPGRFLAQSTLYLTIAKSLAVFQICRVTRNGQEVDPVIDFSPGIISQPIEYEVCVKARDAEAKRLIDNIECEHSWAMGDSRKLNDAWDRRGSSSEV